MADEDVVNPQPAGVKLTYDDFVLFPDDGQRHELIDGEHYVTPSPATKHRRVLGYLHLLIGNYLEVHPIGQVFLAPFDIVLSRFDVVEPDLLYMSSARAQEILTDQHVRGTPELVVEIASPGTRRRDEGIKRRLYERSGVSDTGSWMQTPRPSACIGGRTTVSADSNRSRASGTTCSGPCCCRVSSSNSPAYSAE